jgi:hypothetical protein
VCGPAVPRGLLPMETAANAKRKLSPGEAHETELPHDSQQQQQQQQPHHEMDALATAPPESASGAAEQAEAPSAAEAAAPAQPSSEEAAQLPEASLQDGAQAAAELPTAPQVGVPWRGVTPQRIDVLPSGALFVVSQGSVVRFRGDALVNAANRGCLGGGGVDGAVNDAGGRRCARSCDAGVLRPSDDWRKRSSGWRRLAGRCPSWPHTTCAARPGRPNSRWVAR